MARGALSRGDEGWKLSLVKSLDKKGFAKDDRITLFMFINWLLALPEPLEIEFNEDMKRYEEEKHNRSPTQEQRSRRCDYAPIAAVYADLRCWTSICAFNSR